MNKSIKALLYGIAFEYVIISHLALFGLESTITSGDNKSTVILLLNALFSTFVYRVVKTNTTDGPEDGDLDL